MLDISDKIRSRRTSRARATVEMSEESAGMILNDEVPKGNVIEMARAAAIIAAKKTPELMIFCHDIPIEWVDVDIQIEGGRVVIEVLVKTTAKTGCEMEALCAASNAALTVYDMLKPIDKNIEVVSITLVGKSGGKSDFVETIPEGLKAGVLVISDSVSAGEREDTSGQSILRKLREIGIDGADYKIVPDEIVDIRACVDGWCGQGYALVLTTGGTGLSPRDVTREAVGSLIEREIPGIMEAARSFGQERTPYSMLSRGIAGLRGDTLIVTLPGSSRGAEETMNALFPYLIHIYETMQGKRH